MSVEAEKPAPSGNAGFAEASVAFLWEPPKVNPAVEDARRAGLLEGGSAQHFSFRAPAALVQAAMRETGIQSPTELGIAALAALAQPDPVAMFMARNRGALAGLPPIEP